MSFNKRYLPDLPKLIEMREKHSSDKEFIDFIEDYYKKADALLGPNESFEYIKEAKKRIEEDEQGLGKRP